MWTFPQCIVCIVLLDIFLLKKLKVILVYKNKYKYL